MYLLVLVGFSRPQTVLICHVLDDEGSEQLIPILLKINEAFYVFILETIFQSRLFCDDSHPLSQMPEEK